MNIWMPRSTCWPNSAPTPVNGSTTPTRTVCAPALAAASDAAANASASTLFAFIFPPPQCRNAARRAAAAVCWTKGPRLASAAAQPAGPGFSLVAPGAAVALVEQRERRGASHQALDQRQLQVGVVDERRRLDAPRGARLEHVARRVVVPGHDALPDVRVVRRRDVGLAIAGADVRALGLRLHVQARAAYADGRSRHDHALGRSLAEHREQRAGGEAHRAHHEVRA